jgi:hypothetical protein
MPKPFVLSNKLVTFILSTAGRINLASSICFLVAVDTLVVQHY